MDASEASNDEVDVNPENESRAGDRKSQVEGPHAFLPADKRRARCRSRLKRALTQVLLIPRSEQLSASAFLPPRRQRHLLIPVTYHRHRGWPVWIDPVVLGAITISGNDIRIPIRPHHGDPEDKPLPRFANHLSLSRVSRGRRSPRIAQHQGRSESEGYGHHLHLSVSLSQRQINPHLRLTVRVGRGVNL
jgi:hypothetical protein